MSTLTLTAQYFPSFIGVRSGVSVPYSDFGTGTSVSSNGYAKPGTNYIIEAAHFYSKYGGIGGLVGVNVFNIDIERLGEEYVLDNPFLSKVTIETQPYIVNIYLIGLYFNAPVNNTLISFTSKLMAGNLWVRNPDYIYHYEYSHVASYSIGQVNERQSQFVFYYGIGARVDITKNLGINFDFDYVGSKFEFDYRFMSQNYKIRKRISYISMSLGINYYFQSRY
ncbi:MAG: hypothetical protein K8R41_12015 [Bacteroidales bacterium]|nr:hypothetical protein [Bacteroidales bacterium]